MVECHTRVCDIRSHYTAVVRIPRMCGVLTTLGGKSGNGWGRSPKYGKTQLRARSAGMLLVYYPSPKKSMVAFG